MSRLHAQYNKGFQKWGIPKPPYPKTYLSSRLLMMLYFLPSVSVRTCVFDGVLSNSALFLIRLSGFYCADTGVAKGGTRTLHVARFPLTGASLLAI